MYNIHYKYVTYRPDIGSMDLSREIGFSYRGTINQISRTNKESCYVYSHKLYFLLNNESLDSTW